MTTNFVTMSFRGKKKYYFFLTEGVDVSSFILTSYQTFKSSLLAWFPVCAICYYVGSLDIIEEPFCFCMI